MSAQLCALVPLGSTKDRCWKAGFFTTGAMRCRASSRLFSPACGHPEGAGPLQAALTPHSRQLPLCTPVWSETRAASAMSAPAASEDGCAVVAGNCMTSTASSSRVSSSYAHAHEALALSHQGQLALLRPTSFPVQRWMTQGFARVAKSFRAWTTSSMRQSACSQHRM